MTRPGGYVESWNSMLAMSGIRSGTEVSRWYELSARAVQEENTRRLEACSLEFVDFVRSTLGRVLGEVRAGATESCLAE
jgi:hypothetical protein